MASTYCEITWLVILWRYKYVNHSQPASLFCDNQTAQYIAQNAVYHENAKYREIGCSVIREKIQRGLLNVACYFTKSTRRYFY